MPKSDRIRLLHMIDAARKAMAFVQDRGREDLDRNEMLSLALVRLLEIIGEATKGVSQSFRDQHPRIPWKQIAGTRDRLIHGYDEVDLDIVWQIVEEDLPRLLRELETIVPPEEGEISQEDTLL